MTSKQTAQVIYYLSRGGELEHPHSIDVTYLDSDGLLLKDVKKSLVAIRGDGMLDLYSWSYKRSYKDHFIWHDVSDNDAIPAVNNTEFVLKGSEVVAKGNSSEQNPDSCEIQCKNVLKDFCHPKPVKECRNIHEVVSVYKRNPSEHVLEEQCRGEKPLPPCPSFSDRRKLAPCPEKKAAAVSADTYTLKPSLPTNEVKARKSTGSSIFRHMLPCGDVKVDNKTSRRTRSFHKFSQDTESPEAFRWKHGGSARQWKQAAKLPNVEDVKLLSTAQELINSRGGTPNNSLHGYSLPRYLPRYSFSNVSCVDSYDMRPEKVKEVDSSRTRLSTESLYEVDCKLGFAERNNNAHNREDDFFFKCESPQVISKLVQEAKARDDEKARSSSTEKIQTSIEEQLSNKSKLDWDKNLQEAVDMIIHPPALVSSS